MNAPDLRIPQMKVREFLAWADRQHDGRRYELVDGKVVGMAPERARHNLAKLAVVIALRDAVRAAKLPCTVFTDGVGVAISDDTVREPDASVQCADTDLDSVIIEAPLIVVEVVSPSSERDDTETKLVEYFSVASIRHYLIVHSEKRVVVHHQRNGDGEVITTRIVHEGEIEMAPPGMTVEVARLLEQG